MTVPGPGIFYDGESAKPIPVTVHLDAPASIDVFDAGENSRAVWPRDAVRMLDAPPGILRMRRDPDDGARLEVRDAMLAQALTVSCHHLNNRQALERSKRTRIVAWSIAACVSALLLAVYGVPAIAERLVPFIPYSVDRQLGAGVQSAVLAQVSGGKTCEPDRQAVAALQSLNARLLAAAPDLPGPADIRILPSAMANAFALPGSHILILSGLIDKANGPDELAGVIAHELGHAAERHSTRKLVSEAGLYFLLGVLIGDFSGGTILIAGSRAILSAGHSREAEREADEYAVRLLERIGGDPAALASILERIASGEPAGVLGWLSTHPHTGERAAGIRAAAAAAAAEGGSEKAPFLSDSEWRSLKSYCRITKP